MTFRQYRSNRKLIFISKNSKMKLKREKSYSIGKKQVNLQFNC